MSIWDRDILLSGRRLDTEFTIGENGPGSGEPFILYDMRPMGEIAFDPAQPDRKATKTCMIVAKTGKPADAFIVGTLSGPIAEKARAVVAGEADEGDFPVVVEPLKVPASEEAYSDATVIQYVGRFDKPDKLAKPGELPSYPSL